MIVIIRTIIILALSLLWASPALAISHVDFNIVGLNGDTEKNVIAAVKTVEKENPANSYALNAYIALASKAVRSALEPYGFFKATIQSSTRQTANGFVVTLNVDRGKPLRLNVVDVQVIGDGKQDGEIKQLVRHFPIEIGDTFQAHKYTAAKTELFRVANSQGYVRAYFAKNNVEIDLQKYTAKMTLVLATGKRYYFGHTYFNKNPYAESFLKRFITYDQADSFSNQRLMHLQETMGSSFYFSRVMITPDFNHLTGNHIPINVDVEAPKSEKYAIAIGYGSYTGPRLTASTNFRRLTNTGQHADIQLRLSSIITGLTAKYYIPGSNPLEDKWYVGGDYKRFYPRNGKSISETVYVGYIKKVNDFLGNLSLNALTERYATLQLPYRRRDLLYPSLNISYKKVDNLIRPNFGKSLNFTLLGASKEALSTTSFIQSDVRLRGVYSKGSYARIVAKGEFGYTVVQELNNLPLSMRFFAGGLDSIRGYPDSNIGPGKYLELASLEYQNKIVENWWGAVFYDIGTATNHFGTPLNAGAGVGLIYQSFLGPIRVYAARAITKPGKPYSFDFSIGPEF